MMNYFKNLPTLSALISLVFIVNANAETIRVAHDAPPEAKGNVTHAYTLVLKSAIETASNGELDVTIYPNNQLGSSEERLRYVRSGIIQGTMVSIGSLAPIYPDIDLLNLPFAFNNMAAAFTVFDGPFGIALAKSIEAAIDGVKVLGIVDTGGLFAISNSKRPLEKLEDFKGIRIRTMTVPAHKKLIQALGAEAYPLAWSEVYAGLQTGVIDGQMNPIPSIYRSKLYEVQSYVSLTNHLYNPLFFLVNKSFYNSLNETQQKLLINASKEGVIASRGLGRISESVDTIELMKKVRVNSINAEQMEKMRVAVSQVMDKHFEETLSVDGKKLMRLFKSEIAKTY